MSARVVWNRGRALGSTNNQRSSLIPPLGLSYPLLREEQRKMDAYAVLNLRVSELKSSESLSSSPPCGESTVVQIKQRRMQGVIGIEDSRLSTYALAHSTGAPFLHSTCVPPSSSAPSSLSYSFPLTSISRPDDKSCPMSTCSPPYDAVEETIVYLTMPEPILTPLECRTIVNWAEEKAKDALGGSGGGSGWTTSRHYSVPTTDIPVHDIPPLLDWFNSIMRERIAPRLISQWVEGFYLCVLLFHFFFYKQNLSLYFL
jgi:hypothetical protein